MGNIREAVDQFYASPKFIDFAPNSQSAYRLDLGQYFTDQITAELPDELVLNPQTVAEYMDRQQKGEHRYNPSTVARKTASLRSFAKWLQENELLPIATELPSYPHDPINRLSHIVLTEEQIQRIYLAAKSKKSNLRDSAILALFLGTGAKAQETENLDSPDVVKEEASAKISFKGKHPRTRLVTGEEGQRVLEYRETRPEEGPFFINHRHERLTRQGMWLRLRDYGQLVGRPDLNSSVLRVTFLQRQRIESASQIAEALGLKNKTNASYWLQPTS